MYFHWRKEEWVLDEPTSQAEEREDCELRRFSQ